MEVYVINKYGKPLMPCSPAKVRVLLKQKKAKVAQRTPFTIQLLYGSTGYKQPVTLGVNSGYIHIGLSAVTDKKEVYNNDITLRSDIKRLLDKRREYRRTRRGRLWYRKPRFSHRTRIKGWLAPSMQHKLDSHIKFINKVKSILPISKINIEVASFDTQKLKNPDIQGKEYQNGVQKGFWNVREYVLYRDGHTCQYCKGKSKDNILNIHHLISRNKGGTDKPDNLITLCKTCHHKIHKEHLESKLLKKHQPSNELKAASFMSMVRWKLIEQLKALGNTVSATYGYITKSTRIALGLAKSHVNNAFCIAGGHNQQRLDVHYLTRQVRKQNRSLFKANLLKGGRRKRNTIWQAFGFHRFDKVLYKNIVCFIYGLRTKGFFDIRTITNGKIKASVSYKKLRLLEKASGFIQTIKKIDGAPPLPEGRSLCAGEIR